MLFSCVDRFGIYLISQNVIRRIVDCHCPGFIRSVVVVQGS